MSLSSLRFDQYIALSLQTVFNYTFQITDATDLDVYDTPAGDPPSDAADLIPQNEYTVTGVGDLSGGTIVFTTGRAVNNIISIDGDKNIQRGTAFQPGSFSVNEINDAFNDQTIFSADIETGVLRRTPRYDASNILTDVQTRLPVLSNNKAWIGTTGGGIVAADLTISVDASALEAKLADEQSGTDGALIVGYFDNVGALGTTTVHTAIETNTTLIQANAANIATNTIDIAGIKNLENSKDYILGGAFGLNPYQRGTAFTALTDGQYVADGWRVNKTLATGVLDAQKLADAPPVVLNGVFSSGSQEISIFTDQASLGPTEYAAFIQPIEGYTFNALAQRTMVLTFSVKSTVTGTFCASFRNAGKDRSYVAEYTIDAASTWEKKTITVPASVAAGTWDYTNGIGLEVIFCLGAGTTFQTPPDVWATGDFIGTSNQVNLAATLGATIQFDLVKIEPEIATPYVYRDYSETLLWAKRYYEKTYELSVQPGAVSDLGAVGGNIVVGFETFTCYFKLVAKRIVPVVVVYSTDGTINAVRDTRSTQNFGITSIFGTSTTSAGIPKLGGPIGGDQDVVCHYTADAGL